MNLRALRRGELDTLVSWAAAEALLDELSQRLAGETIQLDVPEANAAGVAMANRRGMTEVFGCAKLTLGAPPKLPWREIFGVTTFELG